MSSNALGWVYPEAGEDIPPLRSEVSYGPVHYKDSMVIEFTPASYTGDINLYCDWNDTMQGNIWNLKNTGSPLTYKFDQQTPNPSDSSDYHACHFLFVSNSPSTSSGNTVAFQYLNTASKQPTVWFQGGSSIAASSSSSTSTSSSSSITSSGTPNSSTTSGSGSQSTSSSSSTSAGPSAVTGGSNSPDIQAQSGSSGISPGAIAGIVIGVVALIAIIAGLGFFFGRRARRRSQEGPAALPPTETKHGAAGVNPSGHPPQPGQQMEQTPAWAAKGHYQPQRMGELDGRQVNELGEGPVVHELGGGYRNELPG